MLEKYPTHFIFKCDEKGIWRIIALKEAMETKASMVVCKKATLNPFL